MDAKQYLTQLAQEAGLAPEEASVILKAAENEKFAKSIADSTMMRSDYSRKMDELKAEKDKTSNWYQEVLQVTENNKKVVETTNKQLEAYRQKFGDLDGDTMVATPTADVAKLKEEYENKFKTLEGNTITLLKKTATISAQHLKQFNEVLDMDALEKFVVEKGLPLEQGYKEFISPRLAEMQTKEFEAKLAAAREEGAKDALSRHKLPIDPISKEPHPFHDRIKDPAQALTGRALRDEFVNAFHESAVGSKA
jgi:DNA-binding Lrp family transcriptional regulator